MHLSCFIIIPVVVVRTDPKFVTSNISIQSNPQIWNFTFFTSVSISVYMWAGLAYFGASTENLNNILHNVYLHVNPRAGSCPNLELPIHVK